jgi:hypothetical protein
LSMKVNLIIKLVLVFIMMLGTSSFFAVAQKTEAETIFTYLKNSDNSRTLTYSIKYKKDSAESVPAIGIPISFVSGDELLSIVNTGQDGIAKYIVPATRELKFGNAGKLTFKASIGNNKVIESKSDELSLMDVSLEMNCVIADSVKKINFKAFELGAKGEKKPVSKADIIFYVPRMFSLLKVAEGSVGEDGSGEIDFPSDIPGDSLGNITVICRIEENDKYLNVEKQQVVAWGKPVNYHFPKFQRALWTAVAPTWMIITLTILLLGVWAHYTFVIYKLWRIKREDSSNDSLR